MEWLIATFSAILGGAAGAFFGKISTKKVFKRLYLLPRRIPKGTRRNTVLMIGLGRVGKTQLISTLIKEFSEKGKPVTKNFEIHSCIRNYEGKDVHYYFTDYRGQNFAQLIAHFIQENLKPYTLLRYGDINSLVLVVDLYRYGGDDEVDTRYDELDEERIKEHLTEWNRIALDAVFGLLTKESLSYVCLFINKVDKWTKSNQKDSESIILEKYSELVDALKKRTTIEFKEATGETGIDYYADFQAIIGSALQGTGVVGNKSLLSGLTESALPFTNQ